MSGVADRVVSERRVPNGEDNRVDLEGYQGTCIEMETSATSL
jgi:hypothetical protein